jgi:hypothetical protein
VAVSPSVWRQTVTSKLPHEVSDDRSAALNSMSKRIADARRMAANKLVNISGAGNYLRQLPRFAVEGQKPSAEIALMIPSPFPPCLG